MENLLDQVIAQRENEVIADRQVHVFWEGQQWDMSFADLDVGMLSTPEDIKAKVAEALGTHPLKLAAFRVEPNHETETLNLVPPATFGF